MPTIVASLAAEIGVDISGLQSGLQQMDARLHDAEGKFNSLGGKVDKFGKDVKRIGGNLSSAGRELTTGLTLPLVGIGVAAGKASMDFETSMSHITGLVGISRDQVNKWGKELLELGPKIGKSPKELADALYFVTSSGIQSSKALEVVEASAKAAAAGLGQTEVVADAVTSAMNAYAKTGLSAGKATGILVAAVREGKGEASEFAGAIGRVTPVAAQLGISFDQVAAALASQTLVGFDAAEAATNLSGILSALLKPSAQARDALKEYGLSADELREKVGREGLLPVLEELAATVGDDDEALAKIFPNVRAFRGLLTLVGENADKTRGIFAELAKATEEDLNNAFKETSETSGFKFQQAMSQINAVLIQFGGEILPSLVPVIKGFAEALSGLVKWFTSLPEPTQQTIIQVLALSVALGPVLSLAGGLFKIGGSLISMFGGLASGIGGGVKAFGSLAGGLQSIITLSPVLLAQLGLIGAGLVVIAGYLNKVGEAAAASNDRLIEMSHSGDLLEQAAASTEILLHGSERLRDAFVQHQKDMKASLDAGKISAEEYNREIIRSGQVAGVAAGQYLVMARSIESIPKYVATTIVTTQRTIVETVLGATLGVTPKSKQFGGPVSAGQATLVHPPELFFPQESGFIMSQSDTMRMLSLLETIAENLGRPNINFNTAAPLNAERDSATIRALAGAF